MGREDKEYDLMTEIARVSELRQQVRRRQNDFEAKSPRNSKVADLKQKLSYLREEEYRLNQYNSSPQYLQTSVEFGGVVNSRGNLDFKDLTPMINKTNQGFGSTISSFQSKGLQLKAMQKSMALEGEGAIPGSPQPGANKMIFMDGDPRMNVTHTDGRFVNLPAEILDRKSNAPRNDDLIEVRSGAAIEDNEDFDD